LFCFSISETLWTATSPVSASRHRRAALGIKRSAVRSGATLARRKFRPRLGRCGWGGNSTRCGSPFLWVLSFAEWMSLDNEVYFDDLYAYAPKEFKLNHRNKDRRYFKDDGQLEKNLYEEKWEEFIAGIRHSHRFFNPSAKGFLDSVFASLTGDGNELKLECVRIIPKGKELYRARSASTYADVKAIADSPASQLGPTPKDRASSQRMTPNGISALYCALERETCLSEIRSITGDNVVSIAMTPISQLKLLDLTKLGLVEPPKQTLLEKGCRDGLHLKTFISSLVRKMSKPKGRNDELSYLSTQVVFEYWFQKSRCTHFHNISFHC